MIDYISIGNKIHNIRRNRRMTQEFLAEKTNVTPTHISRIERGTSSPSLQTLIDICNVLDITIDDLMQDSLPATKSKINTRLETVLADCTVEELNFLANVIPTLLHELRSLPGK